MTVWYKQGVMGRLNAQAQKCLGRIHLAHQTKNHDLYITSICEATHSAGSLHYSGDAFDFREIKGIDYVLVAGMDFDVVYEQNHVHVEYDPK